MGGRVASALSVLVTVGVVACGADDATSMSAPIADAGVDRRAAEPRVKPGGGPVDSGSDRPVVDAAACGVRTDTPPIMESPHVPDGAGVIYNSNPPSSGPHYGVWANFEETAQPVDDRYLVHSMEHGAVLLLYKCEGASCASIVPALRAVRDAIPSDPLCDPSIRVRVILAPRPANDVAVAAAAWGAVYRADCVDAASLTAFVIEHYAKAPENFCAPGQSF